MNFNIYSSRERDKPVEQHPWEGTIAGWFSEAGIDYKSHDVQPVRVFVNMQELHPDDWETVEVTFNDHVDIYPRQFGGIGKIFSKVFNLLFGWMMPKTAKKRQDPGKGQELGSSQAKANTAKLNQTVPETFGRIIRYPDYLVPPCRRFENERQQRLEMLLCVGPGEYVANEPKIGNTPISKIEGASYAVYGPNENITGISAAENWYPAPEIGATSGGNAGLELTASASTSLDPTGSSYILNGGTITSVGNPFPDSWGPGTTMGMRFRQDVTITKIDTRDDPDQDPQWVNELDGNWSELKPTVGMLVTCTGAYMGEARVGYIFGNIIRLQKYVSGESPGWEWVSTMPVGAQVISITAKDRVYRVATVSGNTATFTVPLLPSWTGFFSRTVPAADAEWFVDGSDVFGETAGPFVLLPDSEKTTVFEIDFYFPQGLHAIDDNSGAVLSRTVGVVIDYRDGSVGGGWTSIDRSYTAATLDQIGYTVRISTATRIRPEVRIRRLGARSTSANVQDEIQWYGARCLLKTPTSYPWTTMSISILGLGKVAAESENLVSMVVNRKLPTLLANGTWSAPMATRDISAAVWYVCSTIGYGVDHIDIDELLRLDELWKSRLETFDATLDETTAQAAIETIFDSGMSDLTIEDGKIRPVRDGIRRIPEQVYSAQNTTQEIARQFTAHRGDDKDGAEIEYQDENRGWATETIKCMLPDSPGLKLEKIKLQGVTSKTRAWRIGMRRAREQRYQRWSYTFGTELDALNSTYGGFVSLVGDQSALLEDIYEGINGQAVLTVTEPIRWKVGESNMVAFRRPDGSLAGPWIATAGAERNQLTAPIPVADFPLVSMRQELPHIYIGPENSWRWPAIIRSVRPAANDTCSVQAVNYDDRLYADDDLGPDDVILTSKVYIGDTKTSKVYIDADRTSTVYPLENTDISTIDPIVSFIEVRKVLVPIDGLELSTISSLVDSIVLRDAVIDFRPDAELSTIAITNTEVVIKSTSVLFYPVPESSSITTFVLDVNMKTVAVEFSPNPELSNISSVLTMIEIKQP